MGFYYIAHPFCCAPLTLAVGVRKLYPRLRNLFGAKACFFTAAGSPSGGRTLTLAKKNTPYHPKIYPQSLLSLTMRYSFFFIKCLTFKIRTSIYKEHKQRLRIDFEAQTRKICTEAKPPHVPEVYLTVTREILRVSARKIPQARVCIAQPSERKTAKAFFFRGRVALAVRNINNITIGANKRGAQ